MDILEFPQTGLSKHQKSQYDALNVALLSCIPKEALRNLSGPFQPSENLVNIEGLTVLLPIDLPVKPVNNTFRICLNDYWRPFLQGFSKLISKKFNRSFEYPFDLKILYHVNLKGYDTDDELIFAFLTDQYQTAINSFYFLD